jgi:hypothetical protein
MIQKETASGGVVIVNVGSTRAVSDELVVRKTRKKRNYQEFKASKTKQWLGLKKMMKRMDQWLKTENMGRRVMRRVSWWVIWKCCADIPRVGRSYSQRSSQVGYHGVVAVH